MALPATIKNVIPIAKRFWLPLMNMIGAKNEYRVIITSPNYLEVKILFGAISFQKGEKKEFLLHGTDSYINNIINGLGRRKLNVEAQIIKSK